MTKCLIPYEMEAINLFDSLVDCLNDGLPWWVPEIDWLNQPREAVCLGTYFFEAFMNFSWLLACVGGLPVR